MVSRTRLMYFGVRIHCRIQYVLEIEPFESHTLRFSMCSEKTWKRKKTFFAKNRMQSTLACSCTHRLLTCLRRSSSQPARCLPVQISNPNVDGAYVKAAFRLRCVLPGRVCVHRVEVFYFWNASLAWAEIREQFASVFVLQCVCAICYGATNTLERSQHCSRPTVAPGKLRAHAHYHTAYALSNCRAMRDHTSQRERERALVRQTTRAAAPFVSWSENCELK